MRQVNKKSLSFGAGPGRPGPAVLILTTIGRKSGLPRKTPLQYEEIDGAYYVGSARGEHADWYRNLERNPSVEVEVRGTRFPARAEPITDTAGILDFLDYRMRKHPVMIRAMLLLHGILPFSNRKNLERLAEDLAVVRIIRVS
jgi:deazaflavin-dependent oxidoreductase (nitroreductase family)